MHQNQFPVGNTRSKRQMFRVQSISELKEILQANSRQNLSVGLVPTMGALHDGHFELLRRSKESCDFTVVTIFVNPMQFNREEDFINYPSTIEQDVKYLDQRGCDLVFIPNSSELYKETPKVKFDFGRMEKVLEGEFRPGHFQGVALVLTKFFNLIKPQQVYFGLKDLQQFLLMKQLVNDFSFDLEVIGVPTVREKSGLALSSRNLRLSDSGKELASKIFKGLEDARIAVERRIEPKKVLKKLLEFYNDIDGLDIEYVEVVDAKTLERIDGYDDVDEIAICIAMYVEKIRLIDNLYLRFQSKK